MDDDAPAPTRRLPAKARSEQLIDVAERLFIEKGFDRTSIGDIAAAAGVTRPIVYEHHGSKEGIYLASLARAKRRINEDYRAALEEVREPRPVLRAAADVYFSMVERDPERWVLLYGGAAVPLTGEFGARLEAVEASNLGQYLDVVGGWMGPDVAPEQPAQVVSMMFGAASSLARWWLANPQVPRADVVDRYTDFCWSALTPLLDEAHRG